MAGFTRLDRGRNIGGRSFFSGAVQLGNPHGANFPHLNLRRGAALRAPAGDRLFDFARTQVADDADVRACKLKAPGTLAIRPDLAFQHEALGINLK